MRLFVACLVIVLGTLAALAVTAAERVVSWTNPTQYVDGSTLPASDIEHTAVVWGASAQQLSSSKVVSGAATSTVIDLPVGTHFVAARTRAKGADSALSNITQVTIAQPAPNPPSNLTVQAGQQTAYVIKQTRDNIALVAVGQVPAGTECDAAKGVISQGQPFYIVPRETVSWAGSVQSEIVVSACS